MLIESIRTPLDEVRTTQLEAEFRELIRNKPDAATVRELVTTISAFRQADVSYDGLPEHESLILAFVKRAKRLKYSQADLLDVARSLNAYPEQKLAIEFAKRGMKLFPHDPNFTFSAAMYYYSLGPDKCPIEPLMQYLSRTETLTQGRAEYAELAEGAAAILRSVRAMSAMRQFNRFKSLIGRNNLPPTYLMNEIENLLGMSFDADDDDDIDWDDDWPEDNPIPRRRHRGR
jgi:hypothetical protein